MKAKELKEQILKELNKQINLISCEYNYNGGNNEDLWELYIRDNFKNAENIIIKIDNFECEISLNWLMHMRNQIKSKFPNKDKAPTEVKTGTKKLQSILFTQEIINEINYKTSYLPIKEQKKQNDKEIKKIKPGSGVWTGVNACNVIQIIQKEYIFNNYSQYLK